MKNIEKPINSPQKTNSMPIGFASPWTLKNKPLSPFKNIDSEENSPIETSSYDNSLFTPLSKGQAQALDKAQAEARYCISLIEDPLWKKACGEIINMMGPFSLLKIWKSTLGPLSAQNKAIDIYCYNEESLEFLEKYSFVVLETLKRYFPSIKDLQIKTH